MVELAVVVLRTTEKALLCNYGDKEVWTPKSLVGDDSDDLSGEGDSGTIFLPEWFCKKEGLI